MEFDAYWAVDNTDFALERAASGIYAAPEEMAKLGRLYLNRGKWATNNKLLFILPEKNLMVLRFGPGMKDTRIRDNVAAFAKTLK